jgi:hypothetical protein
MRVRCLCLAVTLLMRSDVGLFVIPSSTNLLWLVSTHMNMHTVRQARAGRVVMTVDSTDLLNRRHLTDAVRDNAWLTRYPGDIDDELSFADVVVYSLNFHDHEGADSRSGVEAKYPDEVVETDIRMSEMLTGVRVILVTYGNGVPTCLRAAEELYRRDDSDRIIDGNTSVSDADSADSADSSTSSRGVTAVIGDVLVVDCP